MQNKNQTQTGSVGDLKHPGHEEWMAYLYGEASRQEKRAMTAHLNACADCRAKVQSWRNTMQSLDADRMAGIPDRARSSQPLLKWGIAAAFVLGLGFAGGWLASSRTQDTTTFRASLKAELRNELLVELKQQQKQLDALKLETEEKRVLDNKSIFNAIGRVDLARQNDYSSLRKELETVAVMTQDTFQREQQQLLTLESMSQAASNFPTQ